MDAANASRPGLRVALEGCGHGKLHDIYASVEEAAKLKGWDGVDLVIIGGDFQAVRNSYDLNGMSVPKKYRQIGDFHEYYSGTRTAPYLTIYVGGNHEAYNHQFELYYGGWVAPNIYYLGAANVLRCGPLRIAGISGIFKGYDYRRPHYERLPYNDAEVHSAYHVRELDARKLLQIRTQVDLGLSHDWPKRVEYSGDYEALFRAKSFFRKDSFEGKLGSDAAREILDRLRPAYWFSAHLHIKFAGLVHHDDVAPGYAGAGAQNYQIATQHTASIQRPAYAVEPAKDIGRPRPAQAQLSAWNNFHAEAAKSDAEESARFLERQRAERDAGVSLPSTEVNYRQTWRRVEEGDGDRKILGVEKSGYEHGHADKDAKTEEEVSAVKNSDEINLDLDDLSDDEVPDAAEAGEKKDVKISDDVPPPGNSEPSPDVKASGQGKIQQLDGVDEVSEDLRRQLPASFSRPQQPPTPLNGPFPEAITNKETHFLALGKCERNQEFLQLTEFHPVSEQDDVQQERPFRLHYDKEWLAITRVFADDLRVGDRYASIPPNRGDLYYKDQIIEAEKWVEENIVQKGKLAIPENFVPTAPFYDPAIPVSTSEQPSEYNNPQTAEFCEMLGIENRLYLSEEERNARIAAGPAPDTSRHNNNNNNNNNNRGYGRDNGFGRRGGRGGGRGGRDGRGGRGGRGRGGRSGQGYNSPQNYYAGQW
ncbi:lariat debranching enzyme [Paecilomyces lecythidis]|uniref:Lariat debranching enzyme n=1 Tax=Paecilomyces lecythidis TaxID=3004212 RepID=A0ABR3YBI2_9EURO